MCLGSNSLHVQGVLLFPHPQTVRTAATKLSLRCDMFDVNFDFCQARTCITLRTKGFGTYTSLINETPGTSASSWPMCIQQCLFTPCEEKLETVMEDKNKSYNLHFVIKHKANEQCVFPFLK